MLVFISFYFLVFTVRYVNSGHITIWTTPQCWRVRERSGTWSVSCWPGWWFNHWLVLNDSSTSGLNLDRQRLYLLSKRTNQYEDQRMSHRRKARQSEAQKWRTILKHWITTSTTIWNLLEKKLLVYWWQKSREHWKKIPHHQQPPHCRGEGITIRCSLLEAEPRQVIHSSAKESAHHSEIYRMQRWAVKFLWSDETTANLQHMEKERTCSWSKPEREAWLGHACLLLEMCIHFKSWGNWWR